MTTHEKLCAVLRTLEKGAMTTNELFARCRAEVPEADTDSIINALYAIGEELAEHMNWIRAGRVAH